MFRRLGVSEKLTERFNSMAEAGVDASEHIQFQAALNEAREDGSLKKDEVLDALDDMPLDDREREYLYVQQYSSAALTNPYRSSDSLSQKIDELCDEGREDRSIKGSLTNAYKEEVLRLYEIGDFDGIQKIVDKPNSLDLYARNGSPYYTNNYVWSWVRALSHTRHRGDKKGG
jgi:hypothetical protein